MNNQLVVETVPTNAGYQITKVNGLLLHSKYNPEKEAEKIAKQSYEPHYLHVVFGYGDGYLVEALVNEFQFNENILVVDPLIEQGYLKFKEHGKVEKIFYWSPNNINTLAFTMSQIAPIRDTKIKIILGNNYDKLFPEEIKKLLEEVKECQTRSIVNKNTQIIFAEQWQHNLTNNLKYVLEDASIAILENKYSCPVVMVSGGPSLTKQLEQLKAIRENVIIVCAGSTINSLLSVDIEPDYVLSIDGGAPNFNHFKDLKLEYADFVYAPTSHYKIRESFNRRGFTLNIMDRDKMEKYLEERFNYKLVSIIGGGTVAHYALSFAKYITTGPIAMIGQDLAFTNNLSHAQNNKNFETLDDLSGSLEVLGYNGDKVRTTRAFFAMIKSFEDMNRFYPHENKLFNCTEGGAKLDYYEQLSFKQFCELYVPKQVVTRFELDQQKPDIHEQLIVALKEEAQYYNKLVKTIQRALDELALVKESKRFNPTTLDFLNKADKQILKNLEVVQMDFILTPLALEVEEMFLAKLNETPEEEFSRVFNQSETLYNKLMDLVVKCKDVTKKSIEDLTLNR